MFDQFESYENLWIHQTLDVDHLHEVIAGKYDWMRRAGHSFTQIVLMIHEAFQGDPGNRYLYLGENRQMSHKIAMPALATILYDEGFTIDVHRRTGGMFHLKENDMTFMFGYPYRGMECRYRGYMLSRTFIDLSPKTQHKFSDELRDLQYRTHDFRYGS